MLPATYAEVRCTNRYDISAEKWERIAHLLASRRKIIVAGYSKTTVAIQPHTLDIQNHCLLLDLLFFILIQLSYTYFTDWFVMDPPPG